MSEKLSNELVDAYAKTLSDPCGALAREVLELRRDRDILDWLERNPDDFWWSTAEFPTLRAAVTARMSSPEPEEDERP